MLSSDSEWEPSQTQYMEVDYKGKSRPPRSLHAGSRRISALYQQGGPLDSQTSDTQCASNFVDEASPAHDTPILVDASVQTDCLLIPAKENNIDEWLMDESETASCCAEVEEANEFLRDEVSRLEALYAAVLHQLDAVRAVLANEPVVLDPTEQSQQVLERSHLYDPWMGRSFPRVPNSSSDGRAASPASHDPTHHHCVAGVSHAGASTTSRSTSQAPPVQSYKSGYAKAPVARARKGKTVTITKVPQSSSVSSGASPSTEKSPTEPESRPFGRKLVRRTPRVNVDSEDNVNGPPMVSATAAKRRRI
ncbi:hypothetical protein BC628DRAFT_1494507 [Trametes gibbosa]|nr:hypothetical protein BC628DRAFT_1494507 [Trametes gibbosa]